MLQLLPPYLNCTGASVARMQIHKCWESKRESEAKGYTTDPRGPMLLNQVRRMTSLLQKPWPRAMCATLVLFSACSGRAAIAI
jgi:hypothetical protein